MSSSNEASEFVSYIVDLMQSIGPVQAKRMFGGHGVFLDGLMFALIVDGTLYLKADKDSEQAFREKGLQAFSYYKQGRETKLSYYQAPEDALEDSELMREWAGRAYACAVRAAVKK